MKTTHPQDNLSIVQFHGEADDDPGDVFQAAAEYLRDYPYAAIVGTCMVYSDPLYILQVVLSVEPYES